jgi:hypothetical protein
LVAEAVVQAPAALLQTDSLADRAVAVEEAVVQTLVFTVQEHNQVNRV